MRIFLLFSILVSFIVLLAGCLNAPQRSSSSTTISDSPFPNLSSESEIFSEIHFKGKISRMIPSAPQSRWASVSAKLDRERWSSSPGLVNEKGDLEYEIIDGYKTRADSTPKEYTVKVSPPSCHFVYFNDNFKKCLYEYKVSPSNVSLKCEISGSDVYCKEQLNFSMAIVKQESGKYPTAILNIEGLDFRLTGVTNESVNQTIVLNKLGLISGNFSYGSTLKVEGEKVTNLLITPDDSGEFIVALPQGTYTLSPAKPYFTRQYECGQSAYCPGGTCICGEEIDIRCEKSTSKLKRLDCDLEKYRNITVLPNRVTSGLDFVVLRSGTIP